MDSLTTVSKLFSKMDESQKLEAALCWILVNYRDRHGGITLCADHVYDVVGEANFAELNVKKVKKMKREESDAESTPDFVLQRNNKQLIIEAKNSKKDSITSNLTKQEMVKMISDMNCRDKSKGVLIYNAKRNISLNVWEICATNDNISCIDFKINKDTLKEYFHESDV